MSPSWLCEACASPETNTVLGFLAFGGMVVISCVLCYNAVDAGTMVVIEQDDFQDYFKPDSDCMRAVFSSAPSFTLKIFIYGLQAIIYSVPSKLLPILTFPTRIMTLNLCFRCR